jgi:hypothetical protein
VVCGNSSQEMSRSINLEYDAEVSGLGSLDLRSVILMEYYEDYDPLYSCKWTQTSTL